MKSFLILAAALALASTAACAASSDTSAQTSAAETTPTPAPVTRAQLIADLKSLYVADLKTTPPTVFPSPLKIDASSLKNEAAEDLAEYAQAETPCPLLNGGDIQSGVVDGQTVIFVQGPLSDTGSAYGFYDADGNVLCKAYYGQGEHDGPDGVDWWE